MPKMDSVLTTEISRLTCQKQSGACSGGCGVEARSGSVTPSAKLWKQLSLGHVGWWTRELPGSFWQPGSYLSLVNDSACLLLSRGSIINGPAGHYLVMTKFRYFFFYKEPGGNDFRGYRVVNATASIAQLLVRCQSDPLGIWRVCRN